MKATLAPKGVAASQIDCKAARNSISTLLSKMLGLEKKKQKKVTQKEQASPDLRGQLLSWCELVKLLQYN